MVTLTFLRLLDDPRVAEEIERYKWIESEKKGKDIGRENAAMKWIEAYGLSWLKVYKPESYSALIEHCIDKQCGNGGSVFSFSICLDR